MGGDQHPPEEQRRTFESPPPGSIGLSGEHDNEMASSDGFQILDAGGTPAHKLYVSASDQDLRDAEKKVRDAANCVEEESPRGVLDGDSRCLDSETETETSKESTSYSGTNISCRIPAHWKSLFQMLKQKSFRRLATFSAITVPKFRRSQRSPEVAEIFHREFDSEFSLFKPSWKNFSILELRKATNNFHPDNVIGKGGYAEVFQGCLADGQIVAIKRLICGTSEEQTINFLSELGIIVHIDHPNTAKLIGFSVEGGMHLILKLSPHGNLACHLHESKEGMEWSTRYKVAIGTAQGLEYLHEKCPRRIIHRDIKASNILLTEDFEAQICDFGLAKWLPDQWSHHTISTFAGTFGYLAPEYVSHGLVDEKTDIFAFGVLLLELITGRRAVSSSRQSLVMWAAPLLEKNDIKNLVDPSISDSFDHAQMNHTVLAASHCIKYSPSSRPKISEVLKILRGEVGRKNPQRKVLQRTFSVEIFDAEEYNATKYLNDLKRHRQVALDL